MDDGEFAGVQFQGVEPATLLGPAIVRVPLLDVQGWSSPDVRLTAAGDSGIVAVGDGAAWGGVSNVVLPFP